MADLRLTDLAWAAGFLEGEGHFAAKYPDKQGKYPNRVSPVVAAAQKHRPPLDRLHALFGGHPPRPYTTHYKDKPLHMYEWAIAGSRAIGVMYTLFSWLHEPRRAQVRKAIMDWRGLIESSLLCGQTTANNWQSPVGH